MLDRNSEFYPDPTAGKALRSVAKGEKSLFRPLVYVSCPQGDFPKIQGYCQFVIEQDGLPVAPALYFPLVFDGRIEDGGEIAEKMRRVLLAKCREIWLFGRKLTQEMKKDIADAKRRGEPIRYFTEDMEEIIE